MRQDQGIDLLLNTGAEMLRYRLEAIRPHLVKGSILAMDELNSKEFPGETLAYCDVIALERAT